MKDILLANAKVPDTVTGGLRAKHHVLVSGGRVKQVRAAPIKARKRDVVHDFKDKELAAELCGGHVHVTAGTPDSAAPTRRAELERMRGIRSRTHAARAPWLAVGPRRPAASHFHGLGGKPVRGNA